MIALWLFNIAVAVAIVFEGVDLDVLRDRKRAERATYASALAREVAAAGFFGPEEAHVRGGHDGMPDPRCPFCTNGNVVPLRRVA